MDARANLTAPLRQQVYLQLRAGIERGTFAAGSKLPPSREHAQALGVARNTVLWALERLRAEGYVVARVGDGSYVAPDLAALRAPAKRKSSSPPLLPAAGLSQRGRLIAETALRWRPPSTAVTAYRIGTPAVDVFPFDLWSRLSASCRRGYAKTLRSTSRPPATCPCAWPSRSGCWCRAAYAARRAKCW